MYVRREDVVSGQISYGPELEVRGCAVVINLVKAYLDIYIVNKQCLTVIPCNNFETFRINSLASAWRNTNSNATMGINRKTNKLLFSE